MHNKRQSLLDMSLMFIIVIYFTSALKKSKLHTPFKRNRRGIYSIELCVSDVRNMVQRTLL